MKSAKTIDEKHTEMLSIFNDNKTVIIPNLKTEIENLKMKLKTIRKSSNIDEYTDIKDKIRQKQSKIKSLISNENNIF
jgi:chaperonin cofactor prefoldin